MTSSKSIEVIYQILSKRMDPNTVKQTLSGVLFSVITELEQAHLPITEHNLTDRLNTIANEFLKAAKHEAA